MAVPAARSVRRSRSGLALTKRSALCLELAVAYTAVDDKKFRRMALDTFQIGGILYRMYFECLYRPFL